MNPAARAARGITAAIRARRNVFAAAAVGVVLLDVFLPPVVLALVRKPWDYFGFNPWLKKLPGYLASSEIPLVRKLEFLPNLALFWFSADTEWGFDVEVADLVRFVYMALIFGAYFALWLYSRDRLAEGTLSPAVARNGGIIAALSTVFGFTTGSCSVVGCGAPVMPVIGLAFAGLSSTTIKFLSEASKISTAVVLIAMTAAVLYLGWRVGPAPPR